MDARDSAFISVAFRTLEQRRRSDFRPFHGSITLPACSPVNASRAALRLPAHDSGPGWLATPYLYDSCIRDFTPVYPGALQLSPKPPILLLVAPGFQFHPSIDIVLRYLSPEIEIVRIALAENWRRGLRVVFRQ